MSSRLRSGGSCWCEGKRFNRYLTKIITLFLHTFVSLIRVALPSFLILVASEVPTGIIVVCKIELLSHILCSSISWLSCWNVPKVGYLTEKVNYFVTLMNWKWSCQSESENFSWWNFCHFIAIEGEPQNSFKLYLLACTRIYPGCLLQ